MLGSQVQNSVVFTQVELETTYLGRSYKMPEDIERKRAFIENYITEILLEKNIKYQLAESTELW